jgi:hypothetical protein
MKKAFSMNASFLIIPIMIILIGLLPVPVLSQAPAPDQPAPPPPPPPPEQAQPQPSPEQAQPQPSPEQAQPQPSPPAPTIPPEQAQPQPSSPEQAQPEQGQPEQGQAQPEQGQPKQGQPEQGQAQPEQGQAQPEQGQAQPEQGQQGQHKSGCLIATAAFGSEIAPQVQFLRNFRQNYILSTNAGSSFMNVFNTWYYSFSPYVADYERHQPWLQQVVRTSIYPLIGILLTSEKAYSSFPGEYGAVFAGFVASSLIGAFYFSPLALTIRQIRKCRISYKFAILIICTLLASVIGSILFRNTIAMMIITSLFVLVTSALSAMFSAKIFVILAKKISPRIQY